MHPATTTIFFFLWLATQIGFTAEPRPEATKIFGEARETEKEIKSINQNLKFIDQRTQEIKRDLYKRITEGKTSTGSDGSPALSPLQAQTALQTLQRARNEQLTQRSAMVKRQYDRIKALFPNVFEEGGSEPSKQPGNVESAKDDKTDADDDLDRIFNDADPEFGKPIAYHELLFFDSDGTILLTVGHAMSVNNYQDDDTGEDLPMPLKSSFGFVYRSRDGGLTWGDRSMVSMYGSEVHLALHPSGKLVAAIRKNRAHRLPGDPTSVFALKQQHGYSPQCDDGLIDATDARISNRIKAMFYCESYDDGYTWVNEQQVATFKQCSGDVVLLDDGTLVMTYDHRYDDHVAAVGIRARVSYDAGATWEPEEYVLGEGENYPDSIATADGGLITTCPHEGQIQAVHWRPLPKAHDVSILGGATNVIEAAPPAPVVCEDAHVSVITNGTTTKLSATRVNMMAAPPPHTRNSTLWYGRNSALIQSTRNGDLYCTGNLLGPLMLKASDSGLTWTQTDLDIAGWGCLVGFRILLDDSFLVLFEPAGLANRVLCTARSSDSGKTWDVRTATLDLGPFTRVWGKDNNVIELPDGTVLAVVQLWGGEDDARGRAPSSQDEGLVHVLRSTDGGRSWGQRASVCGLVGKARLIRLRSGKLLACVYKIRSNQLMLAESNDDGRSWLNARPVATGVNPGGETGNLTQLADGSVLLQFLHDATPAKNPHLNWYEVEGLRAIISHDEGRTWEDRVYVISHQPAPGEPPEGHGAYLGDSIQLANGAVLSTCVHHADTGMRIQAVIWRPQR